MKLALPSALATAAAFSLLTPAAATSAQVQSAPPAHQQTPAPVVRPRPRTAPAPYRDSFPVTYTPTGPQAATGSTGPHAATGSTGYHAATGPTVAPVHRTTPATPPASVPHATSAYPATGAIARPIAPHSAAATGATTPHPAQALTAIIPPKPASTPAAATATPAPVPPPAPSFNRTVIAIDPAHGGSDDGSRLADNLVEKDVTLALAFRLRSLLQARGFTVAMTRDADTNTSDQAPAPLSLDDRAGALNHTRGAACLLLHATSAGTGVHLYHSDLAPAPGEAATLPWLTAQAAWVTQSSTLADKLSQSLTRAGIPLVSATASVRPVDSLTCPALVVELAPKSAGDPSSLTSESYQQSVAQALAGALIFWKEQAQPPQRLQPATPAAAPDTATPHKPAPSSTTTPATPRPAAPATPRPRPTIPQPAENRND